MKTINDYLKLPYKFILQQETDGSYFISVKELPGCMSAGASPDEACEMIKDAMKDWIEECQKRGIPIPEPESDDKKYSGRFITRVSPSLHKALAGLAQEQEISLNLLVNEILARAIGRQDGYSPEPGNFRDVAVTGERKWTYRKKKAVKAGTATGRE